VEEGGNEFIQLALSSELSTTSDAGDAGPGASVLTIPENDLMLEPSVTTYQYRTVQIKGLSYNSILGE